MEPTLRSSSAAPEPLPSPEPRSRPKRRWIGRLSTAVLAIGALTGVGFGGIQAWQSILSDPGPLTQARDVVVPKGGINQLTEALASNGVVAQPRLLRAAAWLTWADGPLRAAEFAFPPHASIDQVLTILRTAHPVEHHLTIPEGLTAQQINVILARADAMSGEIRTIPEGSVLPQTYDYQYGTARSAFVARAEAAMDKDLADAWAKRAPGLPLANRHDALILASIVERETAKPEERSHVAAVYLNRLRQGMKLQADPTIVYLASGGTGVLDHHLTRAELGRDDPFNTYRSAGLPPTPICSPGRDSLLAVLHPADSDDLFFVADGTGGHVFSRSYGAHDAAVANWRALTAPAPRASPD